MSLVTLVEKWEAAERTLAEARANVKLAAENLKGAEALAVIAESELHALVDRDRPRRLIALPDGRVCLVQWCVSGWNNDGYREIEVLPVEGGDAAPEPCS